MTLADVREAARNYLHPQTIRIVIDGDAAKISGPPSAIAPVRLFGTDGKPKPKTNG